MADMLTFTAAPALVVTPSFANIWASRDISDYAILQVDLEVVAWGSPSSPSLTVNMVSGFQQETFSDWVAVGSPTSLSLATPSATVLLKAGMCRFMTWQVSALSGATSAVLWIRALGRLKEE